MSRYSDQQVSNSQKLAEIRKALFSFSQPSVSPGFQPDARSTYKYQRNVSYWNDVIGARRTFEG